MGTNIADTIERNSYTARYDASVKEMLADKQILARILKYSLEEFANEELSVIINNMDEPFVSDRRTISQIIAPAYKLYDETLIVNAAGRPEPRFLDPVYGGVFFQDGIAFALHGGYESSWLITELNETYVLHQLHPYGINPMVPETRTEKDYLNLKIRREIEGYLEAETDREQNLYFCIMRIFMQMAAYDFGFNNEYDMYSYLDDKGDDKV